VLPALSARGLSGVFFVLARTPGDGLTLGHRLHVLLGRWSAERVRAEVEGRLGAGDRARYRDARQAMARSKPDDRDDVWKRPLQRELAAVADPILARLVDEAVGPDADIADRLYLSPGQLRDLVDAGMTIGGHGRTHPWLNAIPGSQLRAEFAASAAQLATLATGPWPFAYPYGAAPGSIGALLAAAGFAAGFTTAAAQRSDRYHIGRVDGDDPDWFAALGFAAPSVDAGQ
jgi:peptidoglycan/xylan/chitin deacetylase (PgdA/CDA1 family)